MNVDPKAMDIAVQMGRAIDQMPNFRELTDYEILEAAAFFTSKMIDSAGNDTRRRMLDEAFFDDKLLGFNHQHAMINRETTKKLFGGENA